MTAQGKAEAQMRRLAIEIQHTLYTSSDPSVGIFCEVEDEEFSGFNILKNFDDPGSTYYEKVVGNDVGPWPWEDEDSCLEEPEVQASLPEYCEALMVFFFRKKEDEYPWEVLYLPVKGKERIQKTEEAVRRAKEEMEKKNCSKAMVFFALEKLKESEDIDDPRWYMLDSEFYDAVPKDPLIYQNTTWIGYALEIVRE